jgi:hypothetical protein
MTHDRAVADARAAVAEWFPECRAAWLGGSVVRGMATAGSDLDITVLLEGPPAPFRDSRRYAAWPVELFVHTETSLAHYVDRETTSGRPTLARLVGHSLILADTDGTGAEWRTRCAELLDAGPGELDPETHASLRYAVTDLVDDLVHARSAHEALVTATLLADEAARLLLAGERHWWGRGKWVARELADLDAGSGSTWAERHETALREAARGRPEALVDLSREVLARNGGPLFEGHRLSGTDPTRTGASTEPG